MMTPQHLVNNFHDQDSESKTDSHQFVKTPQRDCLLIVLVYILYAEQYPLYYRSQITHLTPSAKVLPEL